MYRIIRRLPWIAMGAAGAWLLDRNLGSQRWSQETAETVGTGIPGGR